MPEPEADLPLATLMAGQAIAQAVLGSAASVVVLVTYGHGALTAAALIGAGVTVLLQLALRHVDRWVNRWMFHKLPIVRTPPRKPGTPALLNGALAGAGAVAAGVIATGLLAWWEHQSDVLSLVGPLMLAFAWWAELSRRDVVAWQQQRDVLVCTRVGAPRFAWTRAQARERLVAVRQS